MEKECPDFMKLGLLHVVGVQKATARKQPAFLSYEHKSLQDFGASKFVTERLETAENIKVDLDLNNQLFFFDKILKTLSEIFKKIYYFF